MEDLEKKIHCMLELLEIPRFDKNTKKMQTLRISIHAKEDEEQAGRGEEEQDVPEDQDGQT